MNSGAWQHQGSEGSGGDPARPGTVYPLRSMTLGEVFGAGFGMLRHAPKAVIGVSAAAAAVSLPLSLLMLLFGPTSEVMQYAYDPFAEPDVMVDTGVVVTTAAVSLLTVLLESAVLYVAFAFLAIPVFRAVYGYRTGFGQTLALGRRTVWQLLVQLLVLAIGAVVVFLVVGVIAGLLIIATVFIGAIVVIPALLLFGTWLTAGLVFSGFAVVVEGLGPMQALARSWQLNRGRWWRHIGTLLLLWLMAAAVALTLTLPLGLITGLGTGMGGDPLDPTSTGVTVSIVINTVLGAVVSAVLTAVFGCCVAVMMLNARFEQEGLDVALMAQAEGAHDDGVVIPGSPAHLGRSGFGGSSGYPDGGGYGAGPYGGQYGRSPYSSPPSAGQNPYGRDPYSPPPEGQSPVAGPGQPAHPHQPYGEPRWGQRRPENDHDGEAPYRFGPDGSAGPR